MRQRQVKKKLIISLLLFFFLSRHVPATVRCVRVGETMVGVLARGRQHKLRPTLRRSECDQVPHMGTMWTHKKLIGPVNKLTGPFLRRMAFSSSTRESSSCTIFRETHCVNWVFSLCCPQHVTEVSILLYLYLV